MIVFKNYFKITKQHWVSIGTYLLIFTVLAFIFSQMQVSQETGYQRVKPDITILDLAQTQRSKNLVKYLETVANNLELKKEELEDALFSYKISSLVTISKEFDQTQQVNLESRPDNMNAMLMQHSIDAYLKTVDAYLETGKYSEREAHDLAVKDLSETVDVKLETSEETNVLNEGMKSFMNNLAYVLTAQIILSVTLIMNSYKSGHLLPRQLVSPLSKRSFDVQLILGHISIGVFFWLIYIALFIFFNKTNLNHPAIPYLILNSLFLVMVSVAVAYLFSKIVRSDSGSSAAVNIYALGTSFISGAFVPMELLPEATIQIAKLFPPYYYITNNTKIIENPSWTSMSHNVLILCGFALLFVVIASFINLKEKH